MIVLWVFIGIFLFLDVLWNILLLLSLPNGNDNYYMYFYLPSNIKFDEDLSWLGAWIEFITCFIISSIYVIITLTYYILFLNKEGRKKYLFKYWSKEKQDKYLK